MSTITNPIQDVAGTSAAPIETLLTPRERHVAELIGQGCANREIAIALGITEGSAKQRASTIYSKLGCRSRVELALRWQSEKSRMSTATQPVIMSGGSPTHPARPDVQALSPSDFKVCEYCGGPAMIHPRAELGASGSNYNGPRKVLCCACLHQATVPGETGPTEGVRLLYQVWQCCECGKARAWGFCEPWDRWLKAALQCGGCEAVTRHRFVRVA